MDNPDKFDGFLFGSSRVGAIHVENINDISLYNMTYSAGTPYEQLESLKTFLDGGVRINEVVVGIDSYSYTENPEAHNQQQMRAPYQYLISNPEVFWGLYLDGSNALQSFLAEDGSIPGYEAFYEYGWWCDYDNLSIMNWEDAEPSIGSEYLLYETLKDIKNLTELCKKHNIKLIVFVNPMHIKTYIASVEDVDFLIFLNKLANITEYYNFSGVNNITIKNENYIDTSHYNAYVGDMIIDVIFNSKKYDDEYAQGFGWHVTNDNIDELTNLLKSQELSLWQDMDY